MNIELNNLGKEIRKHRKLQYKTLEDLAAKTGVGKSMISQIENGKTKPGLELMNKIQESLKIDLSKFIIDLHITDTKTKKKVLSNLPGHSNAERIGEIPEIENEEDGAKFIDLHNGQYLMIVPLVEEYAYAGYLSGYKDKEYIEELPKHSIIVDKHHRGKYYSFRSVGDSMDNGTIESIPHGSIVTGRDIGMDHWKSKFHTHNFTDYVIVHKEGGILIKRITGHNVENGIITCHSLNPDKEKYPDFELNLGDIAQIMNIVDINIKTRR
jgi:transcriptional regulator with XRE-family HTH domain